MAVVRNPRSGSALDSRALGDALQSGGLQCRVLDAPEGGALAPWLDRLASSHDLLIAAGGDGTVSTVASAVARARKTLAVIPTGTLNHFARDTGIPIDLNDAIGVIRSGRQRSVDVGVVNGHVFLNNASIGNYPRMVHERDDLQRRGHSRTASAILAIARTWWHLRKLTAVLTVDGTAMIRRSPFIVVGNGSYVLSGLALGRRQEISDGKLSLYVAPPTGRIGVLSLPVRAFLGTFDRHEQFETIGATEIIASFAQRRLAVAVDGEVVNLEPPLEFSVRRHVLRVLVPQ